MSEAKSMSHARAKFTGTYNGTPFEYVDPENDVGSNNLDGNWEFFWCEGNFSCDCNRSYLVGEDDLPCGDAIRIKRIEPIAPGLFETLETGEC